LRFDVERGWDGACRRVADDVGFGFASQDHLLHHFAAAVVVARHDPEAEDTRLVGCGVGYVAVAHFAHGPVVGQSHFGLQTYLDGRAWAGPQRVELRDIGAAEDSDGMFGGVAFAAPSRHESYEADGIETGKGVDVRGVGVGRGLAVAEVPEIGRSASGVVESDCRRVAFVAARIVEFRHGEVVGEVETEDGIVAVVAVIVLAIGACGHGEVVVLRAAGADRLVDGAEAVEAAGAAVDVVAAAIVVACRAVLFAEESGIDEVVGIDVEAHDIEILSVGGALVGVGRDGEVGRAAAEPGIGGSIPTETQENASPTTKVDTVADVDSEGRRRNVRAAGAVAENGAPLEAVESRREASQELSAVRGVVVGVVYQCAARSLGLSEDEDIARFAATHEIALVVGGGAEHCAGHHDVSVVRYFGDESVGAATAVVVTVASLCCGEVGGVGAAGDDDVIVVVAVDGVDGIVLDATEISAPHEMREIVVDFEDDAILPAAVVALDAVGRDRKIGRRGC